MKVECIYPVPPKRRVQRQQLICAARWPFLAAAVACPVVNLCLGGSAWSLVALWGLWMLWGDLVAPTMVEYNRVSQFTKVLAQCCGLGLNTAHAPAQNANAVCSRRVAIGSHQRIEVYGKRFACCACCASSFDHSSIRGFICRCTCFAIRTALPRISHGDLREVFDVQLMANTYSRRHNAHVLERFLRPLQERVALAVALLLDCFVFALARRAAK